MRLLQRSTAVACTLLAAFTMNLATASGGAATANCPPPPTVPEPAKLAELARQAIDRGYLWKIEKSGRTSYLFGTIHVNSLDWMIPGPAVMTALSQADVLALEIDPLDPAIARALAEPEATAATPRTLKPALRARLDARLAAACVPPATVAKMPALMQIAAAVMMDARSVGLEPSFGSEIMLAGMARGLKKAVVSLESVALQMASLSDTDDTEAMLSTSLQQAENGAARRMLVRLHKAWGDGNVADMENLDKWCECLDTEAERRLLTRLNDDRNPALAAGIAGLHSEGKRVFAAVGTLHMFGAKGLTKLLADMGYKVERVTAPPRQQVR